MVNRDGGSSHRENNQQIPFQKVNESVGISSYMQQQPAQQNSSNAKVSSSISKMANGNSYQSASETNNGHLAVP